MTTNDRDKIIAAAKEAGFELDCCSLEWHRRADKFYAIAFEDGRKAEREECAKACDNNYWSEEIGWWLRATKKDVSAKAARKCAEAIRARGDTK